MEAPYLGAIPSVSHDVMEAQIRLAVNEASDWDFVPQSFRVYRKT